MSTGNVTSTGSGIVNVGENIYAKLATTGQGSLAEAIGDYERHLVEAELSPEEKEDQITILQRLGEEAGKPSPNPSRLSSLLGSLTAAAGTAEALVHAAEAIGNAVS